jgi:hypothetical protein
MLINSRHLNKGDAFIAQIITCSDLIQLSVGIFSYLCRDGILGVDLCTNIIQCIIIVKSNGSNVTRFNNVSCATHSETKCNIKSARLLETKQYIQYNVSKMAPSLE